VNAYGSRLSALTKELWNQWQQTRTSWRDLKSQEFEQRYLGELTASVDRTVAVIEQLDNIIAKIKKDCE
jgi:thymidylate synthase